MFAKNKVTQSMLDAVNSVLEESSQITEDYDSKMDSIAKKHGYNKKETPTGHTLTHPEHGTVEVNHAGSYKINKSGSHRQHGVGLGVLDTHLAHLNGTHPEDAKKYVKSLTRPTTESVEIDEASLKIPTETGTKVLGRGYGNSAKAHEVQHKNPFEKGPSKADLKGIKAPTKKELKSIGEEDLSEGGDCITEPEVKKIADKEVSKHEKNMHKGKKSDIKEGSFIHRLLSKVNENKASGAQETFTDNNMGEGKGLIGKQTKLDKNRNGKLDAQDFKMLRKEEDELDEEQLDEMINEVLSKDASAGDWIHDFVHSKNPKFAGKSKAERKKMALGAYYGAQKESFEDEHGISGGKHEDEKEDKALVKKMVKKDALKKEEVEQIDEISKKTQASYARNSMQDLAKTTHVRSALQQQKMYGTIHPDHEKEKTIDNLTRASYNRQKGLHRVMDRLAKEEVDLEEGDATYKKTTPTKKMADVVDRKKTVKDLVNRIRNPQYYGSGKVKGLDEAKHYPYKFRATYHDPDTNEVTHYFDFTHRNLESAKKHAQGSRLERKDGKQDKLHSVVQMKEAVETSPDKNAGKITTDMLTGRVAGGKLNSFKSFKTNLTTSGTQSIPSEIEHGEDTKEKEKVSTNPGPVDIKLDDKLTGPTPYTHFQKKEKVTSEEFRGEAKKLQHIRDTEQKHEIEKFHSKITKVAKKTQNEEVVTEAKGTPVAHGYTMYQKHSGKYRVHSPSGEHVGDVEKEGNMWRYHGSSNPNWPGTESHKDYQTDKVEDKHEAGDIVAHLHHSGMKNEEVETINEDRWLDKYLLSKGINPKFISQATKISHAKSGAFMAWKQSHQNESTEMPFEGPYRKAQGNIKDKSGATHTPMSRAKDLAKNALKKIKQDAGNEKG